MVFSAKRNNVANSNSQPFKFGAYNSAANTMLYKLKSTTWLGSPAALLRGQGSYADVYAAGSLRVDSSSNLDWAFIRISNFETATPSTHMTRIRYYKNGWPKADLAKAPMVTFLGFHDAGAS